jgi:pimeloyl-ACP methyl ester carboxylesterase
MKIRANNIDIEVEDSGVGDTDALSKPVVLLIMGLGMQLIAWPPQFVQALVDAGFRVVRLDNRDVGLSAHLGHLGKPKMLWAMLQARLGLPLRAPYSLADMAADALGALDALGIARAHVVGVSMGGMIAQRVAIAAPQRVISLTSIMSSSGARGLPGARRDILAMMLGRPLDKTIEAQLAYSVRLFKAIGSPGYPIAEAEMRERILRAIQRSVYPEGTLRQMLAIATDNHRAEELARITSPTLVLHGKSDPLVPYPCGEDTARRIYGAHLVGIDGMGHDLPPIPVAKILDALIPHLRKAGGTA